MGRRLVWAFIVFFLAVSVNTDNRQSAYEEFVTSSVPYGTCSQKHSDPAAQTIQSVYSSVVAADCELADPSSYPQDYSPKNDEEFDFIIVGAGSAGAVIANRLTEVSCWRLLLLEAGGNPTKSSEIPAFAGTLQNTELDWAYKTEPSEMNCLGMKNHSCYWPRGKVLGGSSTINYMLYVRGNEKDYNQWAADGVTNWRYDDVLPYFKKLEGMRAQEVLATPEFSKYHSTEGNVKVESWQNDEVKPLADAFSDGMEELGYSPNLDLNGKTQTGFVTLQGNLQDGRRCGTAKAYLTPAAQRKNLSVSKYSLVSKILVDENTKTAYGVEFIDKSGNVIRIKSKKEVIVSAGAINSPQLLMLSGIGPRKDLEKLNIKVIADLPVGLNLQDHVTMRGIVMTVNFTKSFVSSQESMTNFLFKRKSRFTSLALTTYPMMINTVKGVDYPDLMIFPSYYLKNDSAFSRYLDYFDYSDETRKDYFKVNQNSNMIFMSGSLLRPKSKGRIQLKSKNPKEHPKIQAGYFTDKTDIDVLLRLYDFCYQLANTKGLQGVDAKIHEINLSACNKFTFASREYRECSIRHLSSTVYHPCCTNKMGPASSPDSVVDPKFRVIGIKRLRVIDSSAMRNIVSGNINVPTIMMAEKGSDIIKQTWAFGKELEDD